MITDFLTQIATNDGAQYAWLRQSLNDFEYNSIARYPASCDAPVDVITKKQALSAMDTVTKTLLILEEVYERN